MRDFFERYADRVTRGAPDACWEWRGAKAAKGYGHTHLRNVHVYAHRAAYESIHGVGSANGMVIRHRCDNPPCCNPAHLEVGSVRDNVADMHSRGRANNPKGERCGTAKFTDEDVLEARALASAGMPVARLLEHFAPRVRVNHTTMLLAVTGRGWSHLPGAVTVLAKAPIPGARPGQGATKLNPDKVRQIKDRIAAGERNTTIAADMACSHVTISAIRHGRLWSHVA